MFTQTRWFQNVLLVVVAVILLLIVLLAWGQGTRAAQSKIVLTNANAIQQGLQYFFSDQGRYPTTLEFSDTNLMRAYITNFPPEQFQSGVCATSLEYRNASPRSYELQFCLPKGRDGWPAGWSAVTAS